MTEVREEVRGALIRLCGSEPSKAEFARKCRTTQQNVQNWLNGTSMPTVEKLVEIADVYGQSLDALVGREVATTGLLPDEEAVVALMRQMNGAGRSMLVTVAESFKKSGSYDS